MPSFRLLPSEWVDPQRSGAWAAAALTASDVVDRPHELPPTGAPIRVVDGDAAEPLRRALLHSGRQIEEDGAPDPAESGARYRLWRPNAWLEASVADRTPGRALDLGCGAGRDAVHLASLGWEVVALDRLPDAVARGRELEVRYSGGPKVDWRIGPIEAFDEGGFDLVWSAFAPWRLVAGRIEGWLNPGGLAMVETFTEIHFREKGRPKERAMRVSAADAKGMEAAAFEEGWRDGRDRHTGRMRIERGR